MNEEVTVAAVAQLGEHQAPIMLTKAYTSWSGFVDLPLSQTLTRESFCLWVGRIRIPLRADSYDWERIEQQMKAKIEGWNVRVNINIPVDDLTKALLVAADAKARGPHAP